MYMYICTYILFEIYTRPPALVLLVTGGGGGGGGSMQDTD